MTGHANQIPVTICHNIDAAMADLGYQDSERLVPVFTFWFGPHGDLDVGGGDFSVTALAEQAWIVGRCPADMLIGQHRGLAERYQGQHRSPEERHHDERLRPVAFGDVALVGRDTGGDGGAWALTYTWLLGAVRIGRSRLTTIRSSPVHGTLALTTAELAEAGVSVPTSAPREGP